MGQDPAGDGKSPNPVSGGSARLAGMGVELAATVGGACLFGYWLDYKLHSNGWALIVFACIGIVGGLYNLIRRAMKEMPMSRPRDKAPPTQGLGDEGNSSDK